MGERISLPGNQETEIPTAPQVKGNQFLSIQEKKCLEGMYAENLLPGCLFLITWKPEEANEGPNV